MIDLLGSTLSPATARSNEGPAVGVAGLEPPWLGRARRIGWLRALLVG
jgi:hypothetical protein